MGHALYAMSTRKAMNEREDTSMQKVGMREDNEKKTWESYTSRERRYEQRYQHASRLGRGVRQLRTVKVSKSTQI